MMMISAGFSYKSKKIKSVNYRSDWITACQYITEEKISSMFHLDLTKSPKQFIPSLSEIFCTWKVDWWSVRIWSISSNKKKKNPSLIVLNAMTLIQALHAQFPVPFILEVLFGNEACIVWNNIWRSVISSGWLMRWFDVRVIMNAHINHLLVGTYRSPPCGDRSLYFGLVRSVSLQDGFLFASFGRVGMVWIILNNCSGLLVRMVHCSHWLRQPFFCRCWASSLVWVRYWDSWDSWWLFYGLTVYHHANTCNLVSLLLFCCRHHSHTNRESAATGGERRRRR